MSFNVLIIPEDFVVDQYMVKPIIEAMLDSLDVKQHRVRVCMDPRFRGVSQAMDWERLEPVVDRYAAMTHLFLLLVDRDGERGRRAALNKLERRASEQLGGTATFLAENAWQELEVWVLAGMPDLPKKWIWKEIQAERDPKELYYTPYAKKRGLSAAPYAGREQLAKEAARSFSRVKQLCSRDVGSLRSRLQQALAK